ncbi:MAG: MotA/TolQ/ExbB proton channel family protein [Lachnospiraceae bacterium]|nr:MotA/TolQ/ExbB proton channel family protein [Lachnospiraceae bacterium]
MRGRKWYEWMLTLVFVIMALVCVWLNFFSADDPDPVTIAVNLSMFAIVALIFISSEASSFFPANRTIVDLKRACERIKNDALNSQDFLWNSYRTSSERLFLEYETDKRYREFVRESERLRSMGINVYRCDIEDYINSDMADDITHRPLTNQIPGALTGLGILGTFIGLSFGLQNFATGSTEEITGSIAPLMSGIKVAFHTSIYGMVFSLVFNYVSKRKHAELEAAIEEFLRMFHDYVLPDAETDGMNLLLETGRQQVNAINELGRTISQTLAESMSELMEPQFARFDRTLERFAEGAEKNQVEALRTIVDAFIDQMNAAMGDAFDQLARALKETCAFQERNADRLETMLRGTSEQAARYTDWLEDQQRLIAEMKAEIEQLPAVTGDSLSAIKEAFAAVDRHVTVIVGSLEDMTKQLPYSYSAAYDDVREVLQDVRAQIERLNDSLLETIRRIDQSAKGTPKDRNTALFGKK